jgi:DNA-binding IclR family transcriptional regulator
VDAIRSEPGVKQTELADRLTLEKDLVREIMWVMWWSQIVRREKDGRSYRLYLD